MRKMILFFTTMIVIFASCQKELPINYTAKYWVKDGSSLSQEYSEDKILVAEITVTGNTNTTYTDSIYNWTITDTIMQIDSFPIDTAGNLIIYDYDTTFTYNTTNYTDTIQIPHYDYSTTISAWDNSPSQGYSAQFQYDGNSTNEYTFINLANSITIPTQDFVAHITTPKGTFVKEFSWKNFNEKKK
ncbi:MAG: hypothetical protein ACTSXL_00325 [Alphaproteobacteria bacterium]|nr:MAG: hypothetical protein B6I23_01610 [Rickettsiaceae bacterium 4572_127]